MDPKAQFIFDKIRSTPAIKKHVRQTADKQNSMLTYKGALADRYIAWKLDIPSLFQVDMVWYCDCRRVSMD